MLVSRISPAPSRPAGLDAVAWAAAVGVDAPTGALGFAPGVDGHDHALGAEDLGAGRDQGRVGDGGGVERHLVGAGPQQLAHVVHRADAAADGERDEQLVGGALDDVDHRAAAV
jgi:hypothetical protein